jgi:PilZ domain
MAEQPIVAYITQQRSFTVVCPHCAQPQVFKLDSIPQNSRNPFKYECPCGVHTNVLLNARRNYRKRVSLGGVFTAASESKKIERFCTVLDISATGMRIATDSCKAVCQSDILHAKVVLDNSLRSRLTLRCVVRGIIPDGARLLLTLEFENLNPHEEEILRVYLMP